MLLKPNGRRALALLIAVLGLSSAYAQQSSEADYQAKLKLLQKNIQELQNELDSVKGNRQGLLKELKQNETETGELQKKIEAIKAQLKSEEQALNDLKLRREQLAREQVSEKKHIAQQVRTAYQLGSQSNLKLLLNQDNPETLSRLLKYHDYFLSAHLEKVQSYIANMRELDSIEPHIVASTSALQQRRSQLQARYKEVETKQAERQKTLARLEQTIRDKDQEMQQLARDREHVEKLLTKIVETVGRQNPVNINAPFAALKGKLPWPADGKITHRFGSDRVAGKLKWDGVVIGATEGAPVRAVHHGSVVFADYLRGHGLLIIVDHGDGYMSLYAHNRNLRKSVGDAVEAGEIIADVGSTGGQANAGLYFEIRQNGRPANPSSWCG